MSEAIKEHIDRKLARLCDLMNDMATNDMGDLAYAEAALFHTACDAIDRLLSVRANDR